MERRISGHTGLLALIGSPVGHSGSPAMYNYSFERLGLDYAYVAFDVKEDEMVGYSNIFDYLRGKVPGVQIGTAGPGGMPSVTIRGASSFNASTEPLYILDGSEVKDISNISPNDIASVEVLKDASSSIYGVRGANGVIIIKTKSAREAALREQAEKKALKMEKKEARKKK